MVLASGHGMRDVASHPRNGSNGIQDPTVAPVLRNIDGGIASARNGIGGECRGHHDLGVCRLDGQKRFAILVRLSAEACRDQIHNLN